VDEVNDEWLARVTQVEQSRIARESKEQNGRTLTIILVCEREREKLMLLCLLLDVII